MELISLPFFLGTASSCNRHFLLAVLLIQMINWLWNLLKEPNEIFSMLSGGTVPALRNDYQGWLIALSPSSFVQMDQFCISVFLCIFIFNTTPKKDLIRSGKRLSIGELLPRYIFSWQKVPVSSVQKVNFIYSRLKATQKQIHLLVLYINNHTVIGLTDFSLAF